MTAVVEQRLDFRVQSAALGALWKDTPAMAVLRVRAARLASEMDWPNSRTQRPWKYFDASNLNLTPESELADVDTGLSGGEGAVITRFSEARGAAAETIGRFLGTAVRPGSDRLTALHYAMLREGTLVQTPANVEIATPIRLSRRIHDAGLSTPHTLIVTGANSRVTVVQEYFSSDSEIVALPVAEIIPGPGAEVRYYCVHRWGANTMAFANQRFLGSERDATFKNLHLVLGGKVVKGHLESSLQARGTSSELLGVAYGTGQTHADFFTVQDHIGPDTRSDLLYKSALKGRSRAVYYGLTRVGLGAKNADANQANRNLLLSHEARADSDPVLEILTNDVIRVSHGATAGPVDEEQLYYLQTRGIARREAEALLTKAFLNEVLSRIPDETLRDELIAALQVQLEGGE